MSTQGILAGQAYVRIGANLSPLDKHLKRAQQKLRAFGATVSQAGAKMLAGSAVILAPMALAVKAASDMEETMSKFNVVFAKNAKEVRAWSDSFAKSIGRSKQQIASFMAGTQDLFVPLGFAADEATEMSKQITQLTIDLGSFNNMADDRVLMDLQAALTGSGEVMKKYGVLVSEAAVKQELLRQKMDPKVATDQQKVMARLNIIMAGTTAAQGDAARTAGSLANQIKRLKAEIQDTSAEIGANLIPLAKRLIVSLSETIKHVAAFIRTNPQLVETVAKGALALGAMGAALFLVGKAAAALALIFSPLGITLVAAAAAIWAVNRAMTALEAPTKRSQTAAREYSAAMKDRETKAADVMSQLSALNKQEKLNADEMTTAKGLLVDLKGLYGELGVSIDETTGKIEGLTQAQETLNRVQAAQKLEESFRNMAALSEEIANIIATQKEEFISPIRGALLAWEGSSDRLLKNERARLNQAKKELELATARNRVLREGRVLSKEESGSGAKSAVQDKTKAQIDGEKALADWRAGQADRDRKSEERDAEFVREREKRAEEKAEEELLDERERKLKEWAEIRRGDQDLLMEENERKFLAAQEKLKNVTAEMPGLGAAGAAGTTNVAALQAVLFGGAVMDNVARFTQDTAKNTRKIQEQLEDGILGVSGE